MAEHEKIPLSVQERLKEATAALTDAEHELEAAMRAIQLADRADKRIISEALQAAFDRVTAARRRLDEVGRVE